MSFFFFSCKLFDWTSSHVKIILFIKHFNRKVIMKKMDLNARINKDILMLNILWSVSHF